MSDWVREVDQMSQSVQYTGASQESNPLLNGPHRESPVTRYFWILFLTILFGMGSGIGFYLLFKEEAEWPSNTLYVPITREDWNASSPLLPQETVSYPVSHIQITQTSTDNCDNRQQCESILRDIQDNHVRRNMSDIGYNFMIGGDGRIYEGRGWMYKSGFRDEEIVIALIGSFNYIGPPKAQTQELKILIQNAIDKNILNECFTISLYKENPNEGAGQLTSIFKRLLTEINRRKKLYNCR